MTALATPTVADPEIRVRVLGKPGQWTTWKINQNLTDRWGEINVHRADSKPLDRLTGNPELLASLRAQMWDEATFVVRKDGLFGILYEVEWSSKESDRHLHDDDSQFLASLPSHDELVARMDDFLQQMVPLYPGVAFCIPHEAEIANERVAAWAFVPQDHSMTAGQRDELGNALLSMKLPSVSVAFNVQIGRSLVVEAARFFRDQEFIDWLNNDEPKFTWHQGGAPTEWSDVIVLVDSSLNGEGADSDMPEHIWSEIVGICRIHCRPDRSGHITVRLTNLADDAATQKGDQKT